VTRRKSTPPPSTRLPELLTVQEAADSSRQSERTVWRWINEKHLPVYRLGRRVLISVEDLARFLAGHRQG
jgi:excisionase family DNA binding protein